MHSQPNPSGQEFLRRSDDALRRALGTDILAALADDQVVEIMLNPTGDLWTDSHADGMHCIGKVDRVRAMSIVATVAAMLGATVTADNPIYVAAEVMLRRQISWASEAGLNPTGRT